jgi:hypothetical protein
MTEGTSEVLTLNQESSSKLVDNPTIVEARQVLDRSRERYWGKQLREGARALSPEMQTFANQAKDWLGNYFRQECNVADFDWNEQILTVDTIAKNDNTSLQTFGDTRYGIIRIAEGSLNNLIDHKPLRDFVEATTIVEELYHTAGIKTFNIKENNDSGSTVAMERSGLQHAQRGASVIEEGLAANIRIRAQQELVTKMFPEGAQIYDALFSQQGQQQNPALSKNGSFLYSFKDGQSKWIPTPNFAGLMVIRQLGKHVLDFNRLAENSRLTRNTLQLARAIKNRYGAGSYERIMATQDATVSDTLKFVSSPPSST